jgi:hypothetical protein
MAKASIRRASAVWARSGKPLRSSRLCGVGPVRKASAFVPPLRCEPSPESPAPDQITVAPEPELDSMRGTIAFWMESSNVTQLPNPYAILFDRRAQKADGLSTTGGDVIYQGPDGHLDNQAQTAAAGTVNAQSTGFMVTDEHNAPKFLWLWLAKCPCSA